MKIAVSATSGSLLAQIDPRFGRCPYFVIVDPDTMMSFDVLSNPSQYAGSGAGIQAAQTVASQGVHAVLTGNVGPNAFQSLSEVGVTIITDLSGTVRDAVEKFKTGQLQKAPALTTLVGFGAGGSSGTGLGEGRGGGHGMGRIQGTSMGIGRGRFTPSVPVNPSTTPVTPTPQASREQEVLMLEMEMKCLQRQLDQIRKRVKELMARE